MSGDSPYVEIQASEREYSNPGMDELDRYYGYGRGK